MKPQKTQGVFKRLLNLGAGSAGYTAPDPLQSLPKDQLILMVKALQDQNLALHGAVSTQHDVANNALRMLGGMYQFMFGIVLTYIAALRNFKEAGNTKPIPSMWLAARVCEHFEHMFDTFPDITKLDIGPNKALIENLYQTAMRPLNRGSKLGVYLYGPEGQQAQEDPASALFGPAPRVPASQAPAEAVQEEAGEEDAAGE